MTPYVINNPPDHSSTEQAARKLAERLIEYWYRQGYMIKAWPVPVCIPHSDGREGVIMFCWGVRSNIVMVMRKGATQSITR